MTVGNSVAFIGLGLTMALLPELAPDYFPLGAGGESTSALWLQSMGAVQTIIGSCGVAGRLASLARRSVRRWGSRAAVVWRHPVRSIASFPAEREPRSGLPSACAGPDESFADLDPAL